MLQLSALLSGIINVLTAPARIVVTGVNSLRMLNPLRGLGSLWASVRRAPAQIVAPFSQLLSRVGIKVSSPKLEKRDPRADLREAFTRDAERRSRRAVAQIARVSQIHLVGADDQRFIVHVGSAAGRAETRLDMYADGQPIRLHFRPAEASATRAPILLTSVSGPVETRINEAVPKFPAALAAGDTLSLSGQPYRVELFFFDRTPVVTRVDASYATSTGPHRTGNQDAVAVAQDRRGYLFAVADGVGAGQDGDEVSAFAARYLLAAFYRNLPYDLPWSDILATAFRHINAEVRTWVRRSPNPAGTTLTAAVVKDWTLYLAHVGDSRAYLLRQNALQQLTRDHMQRQPYELATVVAANAVEPPPLRDVLTRAIGKTDGIEPDVLTLPLLPGDRVLICSDGLTNTVPTAEITAILGGNTAYAAGLLVRRAVELEAKDNISAVVFECLSEAYLDDSWDAVAGDRVFTGPPRAGALKMRKPGDMITQAGPSPAGCLMLLSLLALAAYWIFTR